MGYCSLSLDYILGIKDVPGGKLQKHYEAVISDLWNSFSLDAFERLLGSSSNLVSCDGLMILSELGERGREATDLALTHVRHPDWTARFYLVDHLLACHQSLTDQQTAKALILAADERVDVRCKVMELLACLGVSKVLAVRQQLVNDESRSIIEEGVQIFIEEGDPVTVFEGFLDQYDPVLLCFAGARLLMAWKLKGYRKSLQVESLAYEVRYLKQRYNRIFSS